MPIKKVKKRAGIENRLDGGHFDGTRFGEPSSPLEFPAAFDFCDDRKGVPPSAQEMASFVRESGSTGKYWTRLLAAYFMHEEKLCVVFDDAPDSALLRMVGFSFSDSYELNRNVDESGKESGLFGEFIARAERDVRLVNLYVMDNLIRAAYLRAALGCAASLCRDIKLPTPDEAFKLVYPDKYDKLYRAGNIEFMPRLAHIRPVVLEDGVLNAVASFKESHAVHPVFNPQPFRR